MSEHDPQTPASPESPATPVGGDAGVPADESSAPGGAPGTSAPGGADGVDGLDGWRASMPPPSGPTLPSPVDPAADAAARRNWAAAAHWTAIIGAFTALFAFMGPLVIWLMKRDQDRWVARHAVESLNFQLTWLVGGAVAGIAGFVISILTLGIALFVLVPLGIAAAIAWFVFVIQGALAASRAEDYRYPLTVRLITL